MNDDWIPIEDYPIPEFDAKHWYRSGESVLVWDGFAKIADYSYTRTGKGRWRNSVGTTVTPTHWMPLPDGPSE